MLCHTVPGSETTYAVVSVEMKKGSYSVPTRPETDTELGYECGLKMDYVKNICCLSECPEKNI